MPAGVMIETRGPKHSLFLRQWHEHDGETYQIRAGVSGDKILEHFVPRGTGPWPRYRTIGLSHAELLRNERFRKAHYDERSGA